MGFCAVAVVASSRVCGMAVEGLLHRDRGESLRGDVGASTEKYS